MASTVFWQKPLSPAEQHMPPDFFSPWAMVIESVGAARSERTEQKQPDPTMQHSSSHRNNYRV